MMVYGKIIESFQNGLSRGKFQHAKRNGNKLNFLQTYTKCNILISFYFPLLSNIFLNLGYCYNLIFVFSSSILLFNFTSNYETDKSPTGRIFYVAMCFITPVRTIFHTVTWFSKHIYTFTICAFKVIPFIITCYKS